MITSIVFEEIAKMLNCPFNCLSIVVLQEFQGHVPLCGPAAAPVHGGVRAQRQQEETPRASLCAAQRRRTGAGSAEQGAGAPLAQSKTLRVCSW